MRSKLPTLLAAAMTVALLAFTGSASAQDQQTVRSGSIPELEGASVWSSPASTSSRQELQNAPEAQTYSASATSPSATTLLKQPPFPPTDVNLFIPDVYPEASPTVPAVSGPTDEATLRRQLRSLLVKRFGSGSVQVSQGLATFDAASTKQVIPDPRLRAALVSLLGTAGEPSINGILDGTYSTVNFGTPAFDASAQVIFPDGQRPQIVFNSKYQFEDFRLMASILAHESLHQDPSSDNKEELIANATDTLVYGQILLESPAIATSGTEFARLQNTSLLARINSRAANGNLRLDCTTV